MQCECWPYTRNARQQRRWLSTRCTHRRAKDINRYDKSLRGRHAARAYTTDCNTNAEALSESELAGQETVAQYSTCIRRTQHKLRRTAGGMPCTQFRISTSIKLPACTHEYQHAIRIIAKNITIAHTQYNEATVDAKPVIGKCGNCILPPLP